MRPNIKKLTVGATAGNVVADMSNNTTQDLELLFGYISLTTTAGVANRNARLIVVDESAVIVMDLHAGAPVAASATSTHIEFLPDVPRETSIVNNSLVVGFPEKLIIPAGGKLQIAIDNGVAGDSYTAKFTAREAMV